MKNTVTQKDNYVKFTLSDFQKDLAQSTIPFIDIQNVTTTAPLSGIGIYLNRKNNEDVGYLTLKIFTLKYDSYFNTD